MSMFIIKLIIDPYVYHIVIDYFCLLNLRELLLDDLKGTETDRLETDRLLPLKDEGLYHIISSNMT